MQKIRLNISDLNYKQYRSEVLAKLSLKNCDYIFPEDDLEKYCGYYLYNGDDLVVKILNNKLFCDWGQKNMSLIPIGENLLNLRSYPVYLKFYSDDNGFLNKIETYGEPVFRRVGCKFDRVENAPYPILE